MRDTHRLRSECDAIVVGTETAILDNPALTARDEHDRPLARQPLRVVVGLRDLDPGLTVFDDAAETVSFSLDGVDYEIDLNDANAQSLRDALARYIGAGRRVAGRKSSGRGRGRRVAAGGDSGPSASDIRTWARENGWDVPERGRVSAEVREAYAAAH